jgi:hypothetical protein
MPYLDSAFKCDAPDTTTTFVYTNDCPTENNPSPPGKRSLQYDSAIIKRHSKDITSNGEDVTGSGFDSSAASHESQFQPHISQTGSNYFGLPSFEENIAAALLSTAPDTNGTQPGSTYSTIGDENFIALFDPSRKVQLAALESGALTLVQYGSGSMFGAEGAEVITDSAQRFFVYFPDAVAHKGVSRIHLVPATAIPQGSEILALVEVPTSVGNIYAPFDTKGNGYLLAYCSVDYGKGPTPKVFLVKTYEQGLSMLKKPALIYTIVGGIVVGECAPLALTSDIVPDIPS